MMKDIIDLRLRIGTRTVVAAVGSLCTVVIFVASGWWMLYQKAEAAYQLIPRVAVIECLLRQQNTFQYTRKPQDPNLCYQTKIKHSPD